MMWTATFIDAVQRDGRWAFSIAYSDGERKVVREYVTDSLDDEVLRNTARAEVARFENVVQSVANLSIESGHPIDVTPDAVVVQVPTVAEQAQESYFDAARRLDAYQAWVRRGMMSADDKRIVELQTWLLANWLDDYAEMAA